jgi:putative acyl-CoA dehydrogenase
MFDHFETHQVLNCAAPFENVNLYACDIALQEAVRREGVAWDEEALCQLGQQLSEVAATDVARLANQNPPRLINYDRCGVRIDEVEFHPAWHQLMQLMIGQGVHASPWEAVGAHGERHTARAARYILFGQLENGAQCPVTMTYASVPALRLAPKIAALWLPKILSHEYDPRSLPIAQKKGALLGMGMTEKQGGSDVRSNTTRAEKIADGTADDPYGERYRIVGHKWFFSAPQCDAHLILAQTDPDPDSSAGLSCFFLPRYLPDGSRNAIRVQRLKDKLGNCSNASSEVEFCGAEAWLVGDIGRGVATIMEMGSRTRLDCVLGSAGIMRAALTHALHHARQRRVFGRTLDAQPLMQNVLADLALESEAATAFAMRLARCYDQQDDPAQALLARVLTPAGKYWLCKRGPTFGAEAMEVLGGSGYVEEGPLARLYREFPVNSIWEGSGNVMCLDVLRALARSPAAGAALATELGLARGLAASYDQFIDCLLADLNRHAQDEYGARRLAERIVLAVQGALLLRNAPPFVAQAFVQSRLAQAVGGAFGNLPDGIDCLSILARALQYPQNDNR